MRGKLILRHGLSIALWVLVLYINYRTTLHSVLPIEDSLLLPPFALPVSLILLSCSSLFAGLLAPSREAELFDTNAVVSIQSPRIVRLARVFMGVTMLVSGALVLTGRSRPDLPYSTPGWAWFWIAFGALTLLNPITFRGITVEIAPTGLRHPQIRPAHISWEDVADIKLKRWLLSSFVVVAFRNDANFRLNALLWRWRKVKQVMFLPSYFGVSAETLSNALKMRRDLRAF